MSLTSAPSVDVIEQHDTVKACCAFCNKGEKVYEIRSGGKDLFYGIEHLDNCCRKCGCLWRRDYEINMHEGTKSGKKAFRMRHELMCCSWFTCLCACCRHRMTVYDEDGKKIGRVSNDCSTCCDCFPSFTVYSAEGQSLYVVEKDIGCCARMCGACSCCCCRCEIPVNFDIHGKNGNADGSIKVHARQGRNEDTYSLQFPTSASERDRKLLLCATMLVDYTMFDTNKKPDQQGMKH
eukprot:g5030.t1